MTELAGESSGTAPNSGTRPTGAGDEGGASLLEVRNLRTEIGTGTGVVRPVDDVSFSVAAGESVGLVGESGSGKTMTGMSVIRLLPAGGSIVAGSIRFDGVELTELDARGMRALRGNAIAMISQDPMTSLNPTRTIGS